MTDLSIGSLFSGIGGLELGLERAGVGRTVWQVEKDEFCRRVLAKHWPEVTRYEDVTTVDWSTVERPDLICGGFPCQDISVAGRGAGLAGERSGLWREYARAIRELRPRYVVVENVAALLARGLDDVLGDLAVCGYDAEWDCIPAVAVGAPHRRDRLFVVAYPVGRGLREQPVAQRGSRGAAVALIDGETQRVADSEGGGGPHRTEGDPRVEQLAVAGPSGRAEGGDPAAGAVVDRRGASVVATDVADPAEAGLEDVQGVVGRRLRELEALGA